MSVSFSKRSLAILFFSVLSITGFTDSEALAQQLAPQSICGVLADQGSLSAQEANVCFGGECMASCDVLTDPRARTLCLNICLAEKLGRCDAWYGICTRWGDTPAGHNCMVYYNIFCSGK